MKHSPRWAFAVPSLVATAFATMIAGACRDRPDERTSADTPAATGSTSSPLVTAIAACALSSASAQRMTRRQFLVWARGVDYDPPVDSQGRAHGSGIRGIQVHRARGMDRVTRADLADGCVIARVRSTSADSTLGLGSGWTYVWADSTNPYTATMVPDDEGSSVTQFNISLQDGEPAPGTIASPKYICSDCGRDWCVYPRDSFSLEPALFPPEGGVGGGKIAEPMTLGLAAPSP